MKKLIKRLNIKPPPKKFWAREFLIIIILAVISISAYFITIKRNSNIRVNIMAISSEFDVIQNKIDNHGGAFFKHWLLLQRQGAFEGNYESFIEEYGDYSKRELLYKLSQNNNLYINFRRDNFYKKMYFNNYHLDELYENYKNTYLTRYYDTSHKFSKPKMSFSAFKKMLFSNEDFLKKNYQLYIIRDDYDLSIETFKGIISTDYQTFNINPDKYFALIPKRNLKSSEIYNLKNSLFFDVEVYIFMFILSVYGLRLLILLLRWSIKQFS